MKIAVLATNRSPISEPFAGGQESFTANYIAGMRARGHRVVAFAQAGTPAELAEETHYYPVAPSLSEVASTDPNLPEPSFLDDQFAFAWAIRQLAVDTSVDVIANHSLHYLPLALSSLLPPIVTTLHTPPFPWLEVGAALAGRDADFIAVSDAVARQWTTLHPQVIRNGVDAKLFRPMPGVGKRSGVMWSGRITPEKGTHLAIEAARQAGRPLTIAGPIAHEEYWRQHVEPLLGPDVTYAGALPRQALIELLSTAQCQVVTPQWDEPFGLVCVEAALCGTPVVALGRGGVREAVTPETGVVVDPWGSTEDVSGRLAAGIVAASGFDQQAVRQAAADTFDLDTCLDRHEAALRAAASRHRREEQA